MRAKSAYRAQWMADYERRVNAAMPETVGRIDWDTASYLFNLGIASDTAAARYVKNHGSN